MQWKASTLIQDLERDDIEGHLLEQLLKPIHALKKQSTLGVWQVLTGAVLSKLPHPDGFGLGFSSTLQGARRKKISCVLNRLKRSWLFSGDSNKTKQQIVQGTRQ